MSQYSFFSQLSRLFKSSLGQSLILLNLLISYSVAHGIETISAQGNGSKSKKIMAQNQPNSPTEETRRESDSSAKQSDETSTEGAPKEVAPKVTERETEEKNSSADISDSSIRFLDDNDRAQFKAGNLTLFGFVAAHDEKTEKLLGRDRAKKINELGIIAKFRSSGDILGREPGSTGILSGREIHATIYDCDKALHRLRNLNEPRNLGHSDFPISVSFLLVTHKNKPVFDFASDFCKSMEPAETRTTEDFTEMETQLLSAVGPLLTVSTATSASSNGNTTSRWEEWKTVDLRTHKKAELINFFDEESLLNELKANAYLKENLEGFKKALRKPTLDSFLTTAFYLRKIQGFVVSDYDEKSKKAVVKIGIEPDIVGEQPNSTSIFELKVKPKKTFANYVKEAKVDQGLFYDSDRTINLNRSVH